MSLPPPPWTSPTLASALLACLAGGVAGQVAAPGPSGSAAPAPGGPALPALVELELPRLGGPPLQELGSDPPAAGAWDIRFGGVLTLDGVWYGHGNSRDPRIETEHAIPLLTGEAPDGRSRFRIAPDLKGRRTENNLWEGWYEWDLAPTTHLQVGQVRAMAGTEADTQPWDLPFVGYGFTSFHASRLDWGAKVDGASPSGWWGMASLTAGAGVDLAGEEKNDSPQIMVRGIATPPPDERGAFEGFFGGASLAHNPEFDDSIRVDNPLHQTVFVTPPLDGDEASWLMVELGYRRGPFRSGFEMMNGEVNDVPVPAGGTEDIDQIGAWMAWMSWNFHGEAAVWSRGRWQPHEFDADAPWSERPFELAVRYTNSDIDRTLFDEGITNYTQSTQEVRTFSGALSTYASASDRLLLQWTKTIADHEIRPFDFRNRDSSWVLRYDHWF